MARVVRFHKAGGPEVLQIEEMQLPKPKAGEVHIAVTVIGLNRAEAAFRGNNYMESPRLPAKLGLEASGRVLALGEGVVRRLLPVAFVGGDGSFNDSLHIGRARNRRERKAKGQQQKGTTRMSQAPHTGVE